MTQPVSSSSSRSPTRTLALLFLFAAGLLLLTFLDQDLWRWLKVSTPVESLRSKDWYQTFRQMGTLYVWGIVAVAVLCFDIAASSTRPPTRCTTSRLWGPFHRGLLILLVPVLSGAGAEFLKVLLRRERPGISGEYFFTYLAEAAHRSPGLGMASSHAAVAWGGAVICSSLFPRSGLILFPAAAACSLGRLVEGAHFTTDVYVGFGIAFLACSALTTLTSARAKP